MLVLLVLISSQTVRAQAQAPGGQIECTPLGNSKSITALEESWIEVEKEQPTPDYLNASKGHIEQNIKKCISSAKWYVTRNWKKDGFRFFENMVAGLDKKQYHGWCQELSKTLYDQYNSRSSITSIAKGILGESVFYSYHGICIDSMKKTCWH